MSQLGTSTGLSQPGAAHLLVGAGTVAVRQNLMVDIPHVDCRAIAESVQQHTSVYLSRTQAQFAYNTG